jgi:hypothetical protein
MEVDHSSMQFGGDPHGILGYWLRPIDIRKYIDCSLAWPACLVLVD